MTMNKEAAFRALAEQEKQFRSKIPANASMLRGRYLGYVVDEQVEAARKHLQALYDSHLEVGRDFGAVAECAAHPKYAFWLEGVRRHLQRCDDILAEQPPGAEAGKMQ